MLSPLTRITDATRMAANGSLCHQSGYRAAEMSSANSPTPSTPCSPGLKHTSPRTAEGAQPTLPTNCALHLAITQTLLNVSPARDPNRDSGALDERLRAVDAERSTSPKHSSCSAAPTSGDSPENTPTCIADRPPKRLPRGEARRHLETAGDITPTVGSRALCADDHNLLHNAIVHNLPRHGTVQLSTAIGPESVMLAVENTGDKLAPQLVSTLTEPFQRGAGRMRGDHAGVGLGLAIVKSITQAHDGTLTLAPRAAGGLCVTAELPVAAPRTGR